MVMTNVADFGLGAREEFDERSRNFPIRATLTPQQLLAPRSYTWSCAARLNQGAVGACVGFSWAAEINARPVVRDASNALGFDLYHAAQKIDPWPGETYEGTSVLAGAHVAQSRGYMAEYRWAFGIEDLILAVGYKGPAVLGIPWYEEMFNPDKDGLLHIGGRLAGRHAILNNGVSISKRRLRLHNSWSAGWGIDGDAFIGFDDLAALLQQGGEACIPMQRASGN